MYKKIFLKKGKETPLLRKHLWVFSGAIERKEREIEINDFVEIYDCANNFIASGFYLSGSIAVKILSFKQVEFNFDFWFEKIKTAYNLRKNIFYSENENNNAYRLLNAEGDELPGIIADFYNNTIVLQFHSQAIYNQRNIIIDALHKIYDNRLTAIYDKSSSTLESKNDNILENSYLYKTSIDKNIKENGKNFIVDWEEGQKTGFFLDQRINRQLVEQYSKQRNVLNIFGYTGSFSVYAIAGGAASVVTIDASKKALEEAKENVSANFPTYQNHETICTEALKFIEQLPENKYDFIILDPPAFAKHFPQLQNGLKAYRRINTQTISKIKSGGIIFTFSCSQVVSETDFLETILTAAALANRQVRILHKLSQSPDHTISLFHPESRYLKGFVLYVD